MKMADVVYDAELAHTCFMEELLVQMERSGISETDLATMLGKSNQHLKRMLAGKNLTFQEASQLALAVGAHFTPRMRTAAKRKAEMKEISLGVPKRP